MNGILLCSVGGPGQLIVIVLIVLAINVILKRTRSRNGFSVRQALHVMEASLNGEGPLYVRIVARKPGLVAAVLSRIGIDPVTTLEVYGNRIQFSEGTLSGRIMHIIPLRAVTNLGAGYAKPFLFLVLALVALVLSLLSLMVSGVPGVVRAILFVAFGAFAATYYLKRTLTLYFFPASAIGAALGLKHRVIDGVSMDEKTAYEILDLVSGLVSKTRRTSQSNVAAELTVRCPKCGEGLTLPTEAYGRKVMCTVCGTKFMSDTLQVV